MIKFFTAVLIIVIANVLLRVSDRTIHKVGERRKYNKERVFLVQKTIQLFIFLSVILGLGLIFGFSYSQFGFVVSSLFAVVGIALFAQWSILSNVTASVIIFFFFPYRIGDRISIKDDVDTLEGELIEITLFHLLVKLDDESILSYPNSMVFQKAIKIIPKNKKAPIAQIEHKDNKENE